MRQIFGKLPVGSVPVADADHLANVSAIDRLPELRGRFNQWN
jgi:hypothetical protein